MAGAGAAGRTALGAGALSPRTDWGAQVYGQPCRECGFSWLVDRPVAVTSVATLPDRLAGVLSGATGDERHEALDWSVTAYVAHMGDNLRIWAERIAGVTDGGPSEVGRYDEVGLARARDYEAITLPAASWSLGRAVADWLEAVGRAPAGLVIAHPERGVLSLAEIVRSNAHDATHHEWDITRSLIGSAGS